MGLFNFLKSKIKAEEDAPTAPPIIEGIILLEDEYMVHWTSVLQELRDVWGCTVGEPLGIQEFTWFVEVDGYKIGIASHSTPFQQEGLQKAIPYSYFWDNAAQEVKSHRAHIVLCILHTGINPFRENMIFTKVVATVLRHTRSIGFFLPARWLLRNKKSYLEVADQIAGGFFPLFNWILFVGIPDKTTNNNSYYTVGLSDFNKKEIEVDGSLQPTRDLSEVIIEATWYVLSRDEVLKDGESITLPGGSVDIEVSKPALFMLDRDTVKLLC
ncbi:MAG: DUF4261 domain-containing protein [Candidatus Kapabacteria bacterium]|nr:DUF4261 domain-containing protein [Candidatus Kapabacteria bacterium]